MSVDSRPRAEISVRDGRLRASGEPISRRGGKPAPARPAPVDEGAAQLPGARYPGLIDCRPGNFP